jgi:hypothetical protein
MRWIYTHAISSSENFEGDCSGLGRPPGRGAISVLTRLDACEPVSARLASRGYLCPDSAFSSSYSHTDEEEEEGAVYQAATPMALRVVAGVAAAPAPGSHANISDASCIST